MMVDSSLDAFQSIKPELGTRQKVVLDVITHLKNATNTEISHYLGLPINQITPRTNELRRKGLVTDAGKRICKITERIVHAWRVM